MTANERISREDLEKRFAHLQEDFQGKLENKKQTVLTVQALRSCCAVTSSDDDVARVDPLGFNSDKNEQTQKIHFGFFSLVHSCRTNTSRQKNVDISHRAFAKGKWCLLDISNRAPVSALQGSN